MQSKSSTEPNSRQQDNGLIGKKVKNRVAEFCANSEDDAEELVSEIFNRGLAYHIANDGGIPRTEPEELVDDEFTYYPWQINMFTHVRREQPGIEWAEIKTAFLEKGLERLDD